MDNERDATKEPVPGDVVQGIWRHLAIHMGQPNIITCQAVIGNLVAFTTNNANERGIYWCLKSEWCRRDVWISEYKVIERGDE